MPNLQDSGSIAWATAGGNLTGAAARTPLTANLSLYVATTGNDTTGDGSVGNPWATIQKAIDVASYGYDWQGRAVTINVADGTYAESLTMRRQPFGTLVVLGNTATPANVSIAPASGAVIGASGLSSTSFRGFTFTCFAGTPAIVAASGGALDFQNFRITANAGSIHFLAAAFSTITFSTGYEITGGAVAHLSADGNGRISAGNALTITCTGSPAFTIGWQSSGLSLITSFGTFTYVGTRTGKRYEAILNGVIYNAGNAIGSTAGSVATGGQVS